jgi:hypothetical protein
MLTSATVNDDSPEFESVMAFAGPAGMHWNQSDAPVAPGAENQAARNQTAIGDIGAGVVAVLVTVVVLVTAIVLIEIETDAETEV